MQSPGCLPSEDMGTNFGLAQRAKPPGTGAQPLPCHGEAHFSSAQDTADLAIAAQANLCSLPFLVRL